jgi:hypothetical protein
VSDPDSEPPPVSGCDKAGVCQYDQLLCPFYAQHCRHDPPPSGGLRAEVAELAGLGAAEERGPLTGRE